MRLRWTARFCIVLTTATVALRFVSSTLADSDAAPTASLTTQERMYASAWWPTKGDPASKEYAGEAACAKCHGDISVPQHTTPMYHAATPARLLAEPLPRKFQEGQYSYVLEKTATGATYKVSDGSGTESLTMAWAFGNSVTGQTYLLEGRDGYVESRLSYYTAPDSLDITVGHSGKAPTGLHEAFGHELTSETTQLCFGCHTTASTTSGVFAPDKAVPGVTCEACHGPGEAHVKAANAGKQAQTIATITNSASMSPAASVDFCGSCHRTFADVSVFMPANLGAVSIRFQPYRLEKSRCWGKNGDARITCVACHDPHKPLVREPRAYDAKCLACHSQRVAGATQSSVRGPTTASSAPACKVASVNCVSCHMPKVEVPQTHAAFTDHEIRIVAASPSSYTPKGSN